MPPKANKNQPKLTVHQVEAAAALFSKGISQRQVEKRTGVSRGILTRFLKGGVQSIGGGGRPAVLGCGVEDKLRDCILARARMGCPYTKKELLDLVSEFVQQNHLHIPFRNGRPGKNWYRGFMKRNPQISLKKPEGLEKARVQARDPFVVHEFYHKLKEIVDKNNIKSFLC